ncbi:MarR family winged helix-turn-helix transcriptional regulator [Evansella halocellulosilytica]|uniref:MarR family winged helix-turn-helix transcriptional regulator n=1 Tax=Evansella halocellulosilytica TaxID=2011013 RepID=UPI000BB7BDDF|nr:MarR family transcriptional regulator [Evansella halocellulosilytica]
MNHDLQTDMQTDSNALGMYISAIYRHLQILVSDDLEEYNIGSGQLSFLLAIATTEGISQKKLSEELLIDKTTTAKAIRKLEAEGYVRREVDRSDKRYQMLYLTDGGKEVVPKIEEKLEKITRQSLTGINNEELKVMMSGLKKVLQSVSNQVNEIRKNR